MTAKEAFLKAEIVTHWKFFFNSKDFSAFFFREASIFEALCDLLTMYSEAPFLLFLRLKMPPLEVFLAFSFSISSHNIISWRCLEKGSSDPIPSCPYLLSPPTYKKQETVSTKMCESPTQTSFI